jgi:hypothetical protein
MCAVTAGIVADGYATNTDKEATCNTSCMKLWKRTQSLLLYQGISEVYRSATATEALHQEPLQQSKCKLHLTRCGN